MASYGLKATVTAVLNDDDYDIGVTYSDSGGFSFDKRLTGDLDNIEQDLTAAILEAYLDRLKQSKKKTAAKPQTSTPLSTTDTPAVAENPVASKFAELEEENRRLNDKINSFMSVHTAKPEVHKDTSRRKPDNSIHHRRVSDLDPLFSREVKELQGLFRLLGF